MKVKINYEVLNRAGKLWCAVHDQIKSDRPKLDQRGVEFLTDLVMSSPGAIRITEEKPDVEKTASSCPRCGSLKEARERRPNGNSKCLDCGNVTKSSLWVTMVISEGPE
jgi:hypothetical protein